jgi:Histidine kinase
MINARIYRTYHIYSSSGLAKEASHPARGSTAKPLFDKPKNWFNFLLHLIGWMGIYILPVLLMGQGKTAVNFLQQQTIVHLLSCILLASFAYLHYYWMVPELLFKKQSPKYIVIAGLFLLAVVGADYTAGLQDNSILYYSLLIFTASLCYGIVRHQQLLAVVREKTIANMHAKLLNTAIKLHFLFNSLNWMYAMSLTNPSATPDAILQLSSLMRHLMEEPDNSFIDIKKELDYIRDYTALQKGRLGDTVSVQCRLPAGKVTGKIAPLLLMSVIENAFKYGVNTMEEAAIDIDVSVTNNRLFLQVINNKLVQHETPVSGGRGLRNTRERLELMYPGMHELEILENKKIYSVKLKVNII